MLLLFWKALDLLNAGPINSIRWYHTTDSPPRCILTGDYGLSVVNPYLNHEYQECSYVLAGDRCVTSDVYTDALLFGVVSGGLFKIPWSYVKSQLCNVADPVNMTTAVEPFTTFSGLLSGDIVSVEANGDYLGVVTSSGFCYGRAGETEYSVYVTESGKDCYVSEADVVYLAEGNRVLSAGSPTDFGTWDREYEVGTEINNIWVTQKDGVDTLYVATQSGVHVYQQDNHFVYGSANYSEIKAEVGTNYYRGHVFCLTDNTVDILNMRNKSLEDSITYSGVAAVGLENKRLYSK